MDRGRLRRAERNLIARSYLPRPSCQDLRALAGSIFVFLFTQTLTLFSRPTQGGNEDMKPAASSQYLYARFLPRGWWALFPYILQCVQVGDSVIDLMSLFPPKLRTSWRREIF
jgi:hypothetical protein